ncbi:transposase [Streptomyces thinghirensis]|uniref:transposase n=1 Tax=Streptomyces thinghirensis TaxID=551547 RepID=UPI0031ED9531
MAFLLRDLPVQVLARMRSDRVLRRAVPPRQPGTMGRPPRHGGEFVFGQSDTWGTPRHRDRYRYPALWHRAGPLLGPAASQADPPLLLGCGRRHPPHHRGDGDSPGHRPPAQRSHPQAGLAVVVGHWCYGSRRRSPLAVLPAALRH